ncbi:MAG: 5-methyltetrahydropteroyltriglutamate--homocysteine S-methyltransferase [Tissierellia bacterium]|nr:5-methyltetrahydropteroyltriglutamate--homocysteine S-methyltransferase [Tissierellia bacterium]
MNKAPFRHDIVGSFLRPESLKKAREDCSNGIITKEELKRVEDNEIVKLIDKQKENGLKAVTDGEFRRRWWHLDFIEQLNGIKKVSLGDIELFNVNAKDVESFYVEDEISFSQNHSFINDFNFMKENAGDLLVKQTIPGPNMIYNSYIFMNDNKTSNPYYNNVEKFESDLAETYQDIIETFYNEGCKYLQLDDTSWGALIDPKYQAQLKELGYDYKELIQRYGEVTENALKNKPDDMVITIHVCRGNFQSSWLYEGDYEAIAKRLFGIEAIDGFFMEYDTDRAGGFESLKYLKNQKIVLGLVTTKNTEMESKDVLIERINEASKYVPLSQICISPQCGFASTVEGNKMNEEVQWAKIRLCKEVADEVLK